MVLKILQTLVVITSLNYSTDIVPNIPQGNNTTEIKNIQDDDINKVQDNNSKGNTVHHRCKHQLSVTWEGISVSHGDLGLLPSTLRHNFQYTYWFNNHIGLTSKASYGNMYFNLINGDGCLSILQLGLGIRFSYNGRIGNNSTFYSGKIMIDAMFGNSFKRFPDADKYVTRTTDNCLFNYRKLAWYQELIRMYKEEPWLLLPGEEEMIESWYE